MGFTKFTENVNNHQGLPDHPALSSSELKRLFDKAGIDIKNYINQILTEELDTKESNIRQSIQQNTSSINNMLNTVYPIGSIYMSVNNENPSTIFGGNWVAWGAGRVPVGVSSETEFNTVEKTGGEKTHTLTIAQIPSHGHAVSITSSGSCTTNETGSHTHNMYIKEDVTAGAKARRIGSTNDYTRSGPNNMSYAGAHKHTVPNHTHTVKQSNAGGNGAHNNLQPYITCYMWKRTA